METTMQNLIKELKQFKKFPMVDQPTIDAAIGFAENRLDYEKRQLFNFWQGGIECTEEGGKSFDQFCSENF